MTRFTNPWPSHSAPTWRTTLAAITLGRSKESLDVFIPAVSSPNFSTQLTQLSFMWLGHASVYLLVPSQDRPVGVLFDPVFSKRCSPLSCAGPQRQIPSPCKVQDLPSVDYVVISHDHYDHLDHWSISDVELYRPGVRYMAPLGVRSWLDRRGIPSSRVVEMKWWDEFTIGGTMLQDAKGRQCDEREPSGGLSETRGPTRVETITQVTRRALSSMRYPKNTGLEVKVEMQRLDQKSGCGPRPQNAPRELVLRCEQPKNTASSQAESKHNDEQPGSATLLPQLESMIRFICTPAKHNSGRGLIRNKTLWASWYLEISGTGHRSTKIYFGGDTGYRAKFGGPVCPIFREIVARFGSPDLAFLPVAAGSVLPFLEQLLPVQLDHASLTSSLHSTPSDAMEIHSVLGARRSIGIHWGTFTTKQHAAQTVKQVAEAKQEQAAIQTSAPHKTLELVDVGKVYCIDVE